MLENHGFIKKVAKNYDPHFPVSGQKAIWPIFVGYRNFIRQTYSRLLKPV